MDMDQYMGKLDKLAALTDDKLDDMLTISWVSNRGYYGVFLREWQRRARAKNEPGN